MPKVKKVKITQIKSPIGREKDQRDTLIGLKLNKINRSMILIHTDALEGMIRKVKHLVKIEDI